MFLWLIWTSLNLTPYKEFLQNAAKISRKLPFVSLLLEEAAVAAESLPFELMPENPDVEVGRQHLVTPLKQPNGQCVLNLGASPKLLL